jgi:hypothetical protein
MGVQGWKSEGDEETEKEEDNGMNGGGDRKGWYGYLLSLSDPWSRR